MRNMPRKKANILILLTTEANIHKIVIVVDGLGCMYVLLGFKDVQRRF